MRIPRTDDIREVYRWRLFISNTMLKKQDLLLVMHEDMMSNPANGDIIIANNGKWTRLPKGIDGQVLKIVNGLPRWSS